MAHQRATQINTVRPGIHSMQAIQNRLQSLEIKEVNWNNKEIFRGQDCYWEQHIIVHVRSKGNRK